ncbi:MAG TPA: DNA/RNA non-specific endonuclease [Prolixibacteraceae bacterium]|nr:DNA/RNA non-specific endonuclease [Prolixibacteraceae bacterium]
MRNALLTALMLVFFLCSYGVEPLRSNTFAEELSPVSEGEIVEHTYYKLAYSEKNEQPFWVYYMLTPDFLNRSIDRTDDFRADPKVKTGSATPDDYKDSGTDRGHLCPAADMKLNTVSVSESFFMSNMSPQMPSFNRGIWSKLEAQVREWAKSEDTILVATGPVFKNDKGTIGANKVTIPGYYYKVIYDITGKKKMIAFLLENEASTKSLESFVVSVDSIEALTGIDFFAALPAGLESKLESRSDVALWDFSTGDAPSVSKQSAKSTVSKSASAKSEATQCLGIAKSTGKRCRTMTTNADGYCAAHQNQAGKK